MKGRISKFKQQSFQTSGDMWEAGFECSLRSAGIVGEVKGGK